MQHRGCSQIPAWYNAIFYCFVLGLLFVCARTLPGQQIVGAQAGLIHFIYGDVYLDGKILRLPEGQYLQMENGQSLRTGDGRAELLLAPNVFLRLDNDSSLLVDSILLSDTKLILDRGSAIIEVIKKAKANKIQFGLSHGLIEIRRTGVYRFDSSPAELRVYGGEALVAAGKRNIAVSRGKMIHPGIDANPVAFDRKTFDLFHEFAGRRSFDLFLASQDSRKQMNWVHLSMGWMWNPDFQLHFQSASDSADYRRGLNAQYGAEDLRQQIQTWEEMESIRRQMEQQQKSPAK